jgi:hypothetical protein
LLQLSDALSTENDHAFANFDMSLLFAHPQNQVNETSLACKINAMINHVAKQEMTKQMTYALYRRDIHKQNGDIHFRPRSNPESQFRDQQSTTSKILQSQSMKELPPLRLVEQKQLLKSKVFDESFSRPTPRVLHYSHNGMRSMAGKDPASDMESLRHELQVANLGLHKLNQLVEDNIVWVQNNCDVKFQSLSERSRMKCKSMAVNRIFAVCLTFWTRSLVRKFQKWVDHTAYSRCCEVAKLYSRIKSVQIFVSIVVKEYHSLLTNRFRRWVSIVRCQIYLERNAAAAEIQRIIRGYLGRIRSAKRKLGKTAVVIQNLFRKVKAKNVVEQCKIEKMNIFATLVIQKFIKKLVAIRAAKEELNKRKSTKAATKIQKIFRGQKAREQVLKHKAELSQKPVVAEEPTANGDLEKVVAMSLQGKHDRNNLAKKKARDKAHPRPVKVAVNSHTKVVSPSKKKPKPIAKTPNAEEKVAQEPTVVNAVENIQQNTTEKPKTAGSMENHVTDVSIQVDLGDILSDLHLDRLTTPVTKMSRINTPVKLNAVSSRPTTPSNSSLQALNRFSRPQTPSRPIVSTPDKPSELVAESAIMEDVVSNSQLISLAESTKNADTSSTHQEDAIVKIQKLTRGGIVRKGQKKSSDTDSQRQKTSSSRVKTPVADPEPSASSVPILRKDVDSAVTKIQKIARGKQSRDEVKKIKDRDQDESVKDDTSITDLSVDQETIYVKPEEVKETIPSVETAAPIDHVAREDLSNNEPDLLSTEVIEEKDLHQNMIENAPLVADSFSPDKTSTNSPKLGSLTPEKPNSPLRPQSSSFRLSFSSLSTPVKALSFLRNPFSQSSNDLAPKSRPQTTSLSNRSLPLESLTERAKSAPAEVQLKDGLDETGNEDMEVVQYDPDKPEPEKRTRTSAEDREKAGLRIQLLIRAIVAQKRVAKRRNEIMLAQRQAAELIDWAAVTIQRTARGKQGRKRFESKLTSKKVRNPSISNTSATVRYGSLF